MDTDGKHIFQKLHGLDKLKKSQDSIDHKYEGL